MKYQLTKGLLRLCRFGSALAGLLLLMIATSSSSAEIRSPVLTITRSGTNVILTWPTNYAGYTLEWATNTVSPIAWNANLITGQAVIGGQFVMTYPITGTQMFYRLALGTSFGQNWVALRTAMKAAGAISYGHQCSAITGFNDAVDMFYLPVPTRAIELANANPTLWLATISTTSGPKPGYGCPNRWEGLNGPQSVGSSVIEIIRSITPEFCQSDGPYQGF